MTKNRDLSKETLHLYIRLSKGDDESYSLEYQEEIGLRRFEELGFKDYVIHNEGIVSGGDDSLEKRPVMKNLFDEIESGDVKNIFIWERSRLQRNEIIYHQLQLLVLIYKVWIIDEESESDPENPDDRFIGGIKDIVSIKERDDLIRRTKLGVRKSFERGKVGGQIPCFGYTRSKDGFLIIDEEEKKTYLMILDLVEQGTSISEICRKLNDLGVPTKSSKHRPDGIKRRNKNTGQYETLNTKNFWWKPVTLYKILQNPIHYGMRNFRKELIPHDHPIIEKERWDQLQTKVRLMVDSSRDRTGGKQKHFYLLKGFCSCKKCGSNLMGRMSGSTIYYCGKKREQMRDRPNDPPCSLKSLNINFFDDFIWETLVKTLQNSHLRREEVKKRVLGEKEKLESDRVSSYRNRQTQISRDLQDLTNESQRLLDVYTKGVVDETDFENQYRIIQTKKDELHQERDRINNTLNLVENPSNWLDWLNEFDEEVKDLSDLKKGTDRRKVIEKYIEKIIVDSEEKIHYVTIKMTYPIVNDKLSYIDQQDKSKGYRLDEGSDLIEVSTSIPRKKNHDLKEHTNTYEGGHRSVCGCFDYTIQTEIETIHNPTMISWSRQIIQSDTKVDLKVGVKK